MPVLPGYAGASKPWTNSDVHPPHVCVNPLVHRALCPGRETSIYLPGAWNHHYTLTFRKLLIHPPYPSHTPSYNAGDIAGTAVLKQWWCRLMTKLSARFPVSGFFVLAVASSSSAARSYCSSCSISTPRPANQSSSANRGERANLHMRAELFELWVFGCLHHVSAARSVDFELFTSLLPLLVNMYLISASVRSIQERDENTFVQQVFFSISPKLDFPKIIIRGCKYLI